MWGDRIQVVVVEWAWGRLDKDAFVLSADLCDLEVYIGRVQVTIETIFNLLYGSVARLLFFFPFFSSSN